jgi:hypothetical protein
MSKLKLSNLVRTQLPEFIQSNSDYENFILFLEAYYAYLDQTEQRDLESVRDIDVSLDSFITQFRKEFNYTNTYSGNEALFLRNIKQLYSAKGSEASFRLLFRLLFNKDIDLIYPGNFVLIPSDGKWIQDTSVFIDVSGGTPLDMVSKEFSVSNGITLLVEKVKFISGTTYQFFVSKNYYGVVPVGSAITSSVFSGTTLPTTSGYSITTAGAGFTIGQLFDITYSSGSGTRIKISKVSETGAVLAVKIIQFGLGYGSSDFSVTLDGPTDCVIKFNIGAVAKYPGYFSNNDGFISDAIYIQDSRYYQSYSYVIKIDEQLEAYKNIVKKYIHPAGFALFGEYVIENQLTLSTSLSSGFEAVSEEGYVEEDYVEDDYVE